MSPERTRALVACWVRAVRPIAFTIFVLATSDVVAISDNDLAVGATTSVLFILGVLIKWVVGPLLIGYFLWDTVFKGMVLTPLQNNPSKAILFFVLFAGCGLFGGYLAFRGEVHWVVPLIGFSSLWWKWFDGLFSEATKPDLRDHHSDEKQ